MSEEQSADSGTTAAPTSGFKLAYDSIDEVPDISIPLRERYIEKDGKYVFDESTFDGMKTIRDVDAMRGAKDRWQEKAQKAAAEAETYRSLGMDPDAIRERLAFAAEAETKLDDTTDLDAKIDKLSKERAEQIARGEIAKIKGPYEALQNEVEGYKTRIAEATAREQSRARQDLVKEAAVSGDERLVKESMMKWLFKDAEEALIPDPDTGEFFTKDGLDAKTYVRNFVLDNPEFSPQVQGVGATGSQGRSGAITEVNPWMRETWNSQAQIEIDDRDPGLGSAMRKKAGINR